MDIVEYIEKALFKKQDIEYRDFNAKLIPNIDKENIIGVRTPELKKLAKELEKRSDVADFLTALPHRYFEENQLHAFIISSGKNSEEVFEEVEKFLPFVDNWATCDQMIPAVFKKNLPELLSRIRIWINSEETYKVRFGLKMLMTHFLDKDFNPEFLELASSVVSDEYYVKMMVAWFFATALAKQYESAIEYIKSNKLEIWTHNKAIQKSIESYRIAPQQKSYLRTLKRLSQK